MADENNKEIKRHYNQGKNNPNWRKPCSEKTRKKIGKANKGNKNGMWKNDKVKYSGLHAWIRRNFPKPKFCQRCKKNLPFDVANKDGKYTRNFSHWHWLCRKCHMETDERFKNLKQYQNL